MRRTSMPTRLDQDVVATFECLLKLISSSDRSKDEYDGLTFAVVTTTSDQHLRVRLYVPALNGCT
jgi:hypothetical protein